MALYFNNFFQKSFLVTALCFSMITAQADCTALRAQVEQARASGDLQRLTELYELVTVDPACDDTYRNWLGPVVSRFIIREVQRQTTAGKPLVDFEELLKNSLLYHEHWMAFSFLGDIADQREEFTAATKYYQNALAVIDNERSTPKPPPNDVIARLHKSAEQSRLLSAQYVTVPTTTRGGLPTGLGKAKIRGFEVVSVAAPITFKFAKAELTELGRQAAEDLLEQVMAEDQRGSITLVGHTDPRGSLPYNDRLSLDRAKAVRDFLRSGGYSGNIEVIGKGEREPYQPLNPERFSTEQLYQLHRRVELQW